MRNLKKTLISSVMLSVEIAWIPLALFVLLEKLVPAVAPGLIWMVPVGVAGGFLVLWSVHGMQLAEARRLHNKTGQ